MPIFQNFSPMSWACALYKFSRNFTGFGRSQFEKNIERIITYIRQSDAKQSSKIEVIFKTSAKNFPLMIHNFFFKPTCVDQCHWRIRKNKKRRVLNHANLVWLHSPANESYKAFHGFYLYTLKRETFFGRDSLLVF